MNYPGLRTFKTALSVTICAITISALNSYITNIEIEYFYAAITAVFALQQTTEESKDKGKDRFIGTIIGMFVSIIIGFFRFNIFHNHAEFLFLFFGIIIAIHIVQNFNLKAGVMIACIMVISSFTLHQEDYIFYSIIRSFETMYGVIVALLVNKYIFPYKKEN